MANNSDYLKALSVPLTTDEIDFCIKQINSTGLALILPYKTARTDMERLDSVVGRGFWQREHNIKNGSLFCQLGIWNRTLRQWVWVEDVGTESTIEKDKSKASDSLKRAGVNLGIGRELYSYPKIILQLYPEEFEVISNSQHNYYGNNRPFGRPTFFLQQNLPHWTWQSEFDGHKLVGLSAHDHEGRPRYGYGTLNVTPVTIEIPEPETVPEPVQKPLCNHSDAASGDSSQAPAGVASPHSCNHCSHCNHTNIASGDSNGYSSQANPALNDGNNSNNPSGRKPWYDTFEHDRPAIEKSILSGEKTPEQILASLEAIGRVNVKDRKAIFAIAKQKTSV